MSGHPCMRRAHQIVEGTANTVALTEMSAGFSTRTEVNVLLWILRMVDFYRHSGRLVQLKKRKTYEDILNACSLLNIPDSVENLLTLSTVASDLIKQLESIELPPDAVELSIDVLTARCAMTSTEQRLLLFGVCCQESALLTTLVEELFEGATMYGIYKVFAWVLDETPKDIQSALLVDSFLNKTGILRVHYSPHTGKHTIDMGSGLIEAFDNANGDWNKIVNKVCTPVRPSTLVESSFSHLSTEWSLVMTYIIGSANTARVGSNVLLYGPPGCGKTEFARAVLAASDLQGFELLIEHSNGISLHPSGRRSLYKRASLYLQNEPANVLLVDEMDGMLEINNISPVLNMNEIWSKASANALLESNPIPTIWITNSPDELDSAQLRRFDLVVRFSKLSRQTIRSQLANKLTGYDLNDVWMDAISATPGITPGLVETLSQVAASIHEGKCGKINMETLLNTALRQRGIKLARKKQKKYHIEYCNATIPADQLVGALVSKQDARCLLYGSTGTGKTAFARYIAETLDLEPKLVRPSDILDMFIGGTERNIADLFESTVPEETLIILDEFESLVADRKEANRNWEVSQVNEMLTQLEAYEGRVVACTNLINYIDPAIRRRFQMKVKLLPLTREKRQKLIKKSCYSLGLVMDDKDSHLGEIYGIQDLAFGHIANAVEVAENIKDLTQASFMKLLRAELESTNGVIPRVIGFH